MKKNSLIIVFIFLILGGTGLFLVQIYLPRDVNSQELIRFSIEEGQGSKEIAANLKEQGIINSKLGFRIYTINKGVSRNLQAGDYFLSKSMTIPEIAEKFAKGDTVKEKITIVEGWNLKDIEEAFSSKFPSDELSFIKTKSYKSKYDFLSDAPDEANLEGYLFPDTYEIKKGDNFEDIVEKALGNFDKKFNPDLRAEIQNQKKTIFEIITIASLIEKEVRSPEDKKLVSGILWKRLKIGMPLQVDAAISYITGKKNSRISLEEIRIESPYNTYKYSGLPIGPISNPGLESVLAAIYPENSDYWYYLSKSDGQTVFSKTFLEHNLAIDKHLK